MANRFDTCYPPRPGCDFADDPSLGVRVNGESGFSIAAFALPDKVRILKTFDAVLPIAVPGVYGQCKSLTQNANSGPYNVTGLPCPSIVTHGDGTLVSAKSPAKAGEELVAYAVGLGQTSPPAKTGQIVTFSSPTQANYTLDFNYRPNALPTRPPPADTPGVSQPLNAGTTAGFCRTISSQFHRAACTVWHPALRGDRS